MVYSQSLGVGVFQYGQLCNMGGGSNLKVVVFLLSAGLKRLFLCLLKLVKGLLDLVVHFAHLIVKTYFQVYYVAS